MDVLNFEDQLLLTEPQAAKALAISPRKLWGRSAMKEGFLASRAEGWSGTIETTSELGSIVTNRSRFRVIIEDP